MFLYHFTVHDPAKWMESRGFEIEAHGILSAIERASGEMSSNEVITNINRDDVPPFETH